MAKGTKLNNPDSQKTMSELAMTGLSCKKIATEMKMLSQNKATYPKHLLHATNKPANVSGSDVLFRAESVLHGISNQNDG